MERRVADHQVNYFILLKHAKENIIWLGLQPDLDLIPEKRIQFNDFFCRFDGNGINIRTNKRPPVFLVTYDRIDTIRADTDVKTFYSWPLRDFAKIPTAQQVRHVVDVIGPAGDRGA